MNFKDDNSLVITSDNSMLGNAKDYVECDCCDFNLDITCSGDYLLEALKTFESDLVKICLQGNLRPFVIKKENEDNLIQFILPVRAN